MPVVEVKGGEILKVDPSLNRTFRGELMAVPKVTVTGLA
jgi:hypothetical protein